MALETVTHDYMNIIGRKREDYGHFTSSGATGHFQTRLRWIDVITIQEPGDTGNRTVSLSKNSVTASTVQDDGGYCAYTSAGTSKVYYYKAIGR